MNDDVIKTHRMPDGTEYRALLKRDVDAEQPYDDGGWPILRITNHHNHQTHEAFNKQAEPYLDIYTTISGITDDDEAFFERYLRIFHGMTQFRTYGPNQVTDSKYIAFDTKAWHEAMGFLPNNVEALATEKPLDEVQAWLEGDVYGVATETRWNPDEDMDEDEGWRDLETTWGFYGDEYAKQAAESEVDQLVANHKVVHRYTEHEKITPHQYAINHILEFLESPGPSQIMRRALEGKDQIALCRLNDRLEWWPVHESQHQRVVFEFFGIDYDKINEERELMLKRLREENSNDE